MEHRTNTKYALGEISIDGNGNFHISFFGSDNNEITRLSLCLESAEELLLKVGINLDESKDLFLKEINGTN